MDLAKKLRVAACWSVAMGAHAAQPWYPINSEQSGAAAWMTTQFAISWTQGSANNMVSDSYVLGLNVLTRVAAATTVAQLRATPAGLTLPCHNGGTVQVKLSRGYPLVLNIEWQGCQMFEGLPQQVTTGPGQITLFDEDLAPSHLAGIRLGSSTRDLRIVYDWTFPEEHHFTVVTRNVRMLGRIPGVWVYRPEGSDRLGYYVSGFKHEVSDRTPHDPALPRARYEWRTEMKDAVVVISNHWANDATYVDDEFRFLRGNFTQTSTEPYWGTRTARWSVADLRVRRITDYANWVGSLDYDGRFDWTWPSAMTPGCANGRFQVRSNAPFNIPSLNDSAAWDSGEVVINNTATFRSHDTNTAPPHLPPTTRSIISMDVRDVGSWHYDMAQAPDPIYLKANCQ